VKENASPLVLSTSCLVQPCGRLGSRNMGATSGRAGREIPWGSETLATCWEALTL